MIRYDLVCDQGHEFDAWFPDSAGFDEQAKRGFVTCAHCNSAKVRKAIMAPSVAKPASDAPAREGRDAPAFAQGPSAEVRRMLREYRAAAMEGSENVGLSFAEEAASMHRGEKPMRKVHGEASPDQVRELLSEGVGIAPLPPDLGGH